MLVFVYVYITIQMAAQCQVLGLGLVVHGLGLGLGLVGHVLDSITGVDGYVKPYSLTHSACRLAH